MFTELIFNDKHHWIISINIMIFLNNNFNSPIIFN